MVTDVGAARAEANSRKKCVSSIQLFKPFIDLWDILERLRFEDLPGVAIRSMYVAQELPTATPAVYFLVSRKQGLLYIGKASNLRLRWWPQTSPLDTSQISECHAKLMPSMELGDVILHWWAMPKKYISTAESILIQIHKPRWNSHRH